MYYPLKLLPHYTDNLWGGNRLRELYGKKNSFLVTGESWELACHRDGKCTVAGKEHRGKTLESVIAGDLDGYVGTQRRNDDFPVLVKFIDAHDDLSIQVHPSDSDADAKNGEQGKAELWYVVDCEPGSYVYYGFSRYITPDELEEKASDGTICEVLNKVRVKKGDVFYILPGTIHAIGAGVLIAEIQQSSDTTFRIYDYSRKDASGKLRKLNIDRAKAVLSYTPVIPEEIRINCGAVFAEFSMNMMFECQYFKAYRFDINSIAKLKTDGGSFNHLLFINGSGNIGCNAKKFAFEAGDSFFIPANVGQYEINGRCRVLLTKI